MCYVHMEYERKWPIGRHIPPRDLDDIGIWYMVAAYGLYGSHPCDVTRLK